MLPRELKKTLPVCPLVSGPEPMETSNIMMLLYLSGLSFTMVICFLSVLGVTVMACLALLRYTLGSGNLPSFDGCQYTSSVTHTPYKMQSLWYMQPRSLAATCYFKSADGHAGN